MKWRSHTTFTGVDLDTGVDLPDGTCECADASFPLHGIQLVNKSGPVKGGSAICFPVQYYPTRRPGIWFCLDCVTHELPDKMADIALLTIVNRMEIGMGEMCARILIRGMQLWCFADRIDWLCGSCGVGDGRSTRNKLT